MMQVDEQLLTVINIFKSQNQEISDAIDPFQVYQDQPKPTNINQMNAQMSEAIYGPETIETHKKEIDTPITPTPKKRLGSTSYTNAKKGRLAMPNVDKAYTADEGDVAGLIRNYGYLLFQPNGHLWLTGLVPKHQREMTAERVKAILLEAKAKRQPGSTLMIG